MGHVRGPSGERRRIGFVYDSLLTKACPETRATLAETVKLLAGAGHEVQEIPIPVDAAFAADFRLYWCMFAFSVGTFGARIFGSGFDRTKLDPLSIGLGAQFKRQFWRIPGAIARLKRAAARLEHRANGVEVVMSPVIAKVTPELGHLNPAVPYDELMQRLTNYVGFTPLTNITGYPAISLPMGRSASGLPIGVQLSAGMGQEAMLLELAYELEELKPWAQLGRISTK
jgi:amidase